MDYGEGIATTGFYVALNEDDELDMVGFSPEAVLRPRPGYRGVAPCRTRSPGKRSATGEACRHPPG